MVQQSVSLQSMTQCEFLIAKIKVILVKVIVQFNIFTNAKLIIELLFSELGVVDRRSNKEAGRLKTSPRVPVFHSDQKNLLHYFCKI